MSKQLKVNSNEFWESKYIQDNMPWDIGQAAPAFIKYFGKKGICRGAVNRASVAVLGCGRGHDAFYLANLKEHKLEVYGFDFSEAAASYCNKLKDKNNIKNIYFYQKDFFELINDQKWESYFDFVIEHTSLCAINPKRRKEYVTLITYLLKPKGSLIGLFFMKPKELGGPPFGSTPEEIKELFKKNFKETEELHYEECLHTKLDGKEWFGVFKKI